MTPSNHRGAEILIHLSASSMAKPVFQVTVMFDLTRKPCCVFSQ